MSFLRAKEIDQIRSLIKNAYPKDLQNDDLDRRIERWLDSPNLAFEGKSPREYIHAGKVRRVRNYCEQLFYT